MHLQGIKALVVDDEPELREMIAFELQMLGAEVTEAENGLEAFKKAQSHHTDIIISDVRMPGGGGIELLKKLRATDTWRPPLILVTGFADLRREDFFGLGVDALFAKPFDLGSLTKKAADLLVPLEIRLASKPDGLRLGRPIVSHLKGLKKEMGPSWGNIGRRGIFIPHDGPYPSEGECVHVEIHLESSNPAPKVEGLAHVQWVKSRSESGRPAGLGLEWIHLEAGCKDGLIHMMRQLSHPASIPNESG